MKPITLRPVACSMTAVKRSRMTSWNAIGLFDHSSAAPTVEQRLLAREPTARRADREIVVVVRSWPG